MGQTSIFLVEVEPEDMLESYRRDQLLRRQASGIRAVLGNPGWYTNVLAEPQPNALSETPRACWGFAYPAQFRSSQKAPRVLASNSKGRKIRPLLRRARRASRLLPKRIPPHAGHFVMRFVTDGCAWPLPRAFSPSRRPPGDRRPDPCCGLAGRSRRPG
jgi:hypothetical protein